jgi:hypothetical protein
MIPEPKTMHFLLARNFAWLAGKNMTLGSVGIINQSFTGDDLWIIFVPIKRY